MFFFKDRHLFAVDLVKKNSDSLNISSVYPILMKHEKIDPTTFGMLLVDLKMPGFQNEDDGNLFNSFGGNE